MEIDGKTVLLTGASGGIGRALVTALLEAGAARIVACDLPSGDLERLGALGARVTAQALDVTDEMTVNAAAAGNGDVAILINCHGVVVHQAYLAVNDIGPFRREMEINYWGQLLMCRAFAPILGRNGGGALVNFLSPLAHVTYGFCANYSASKAACRALTDSMRGALAPQGTAVMAVYPGAIDTPMMANLKVPKHPAALVAAAVLQGLRDGAREIWPGASVSREQMLADPEGMADAAAAQLVAPSA